MATHEVSLLGPNTLPDSQGNVAWQPASTSDFWAGLVVTFADTSVKDRLNGSITIPQNYVGTASVKPIWTSSATTGNVVWEFGYRVVDGDDAATLASTSAVESPTVTDAAPTTTMFRLAPSISLTSTNLAAGASLQFYLARSSTSTADTMAARALLYDLLLRYADA